MRIKTTQFINLILTLRYYRVLQKMQNEKELLIIIKSRKLE